MSSPDAATADLTATELATQLGVSTGLVHRWARAGAIQHHRTSDGRLRFDRRIVPVPGDRLGSAS